MELEPGNEVCSVNGTTSFRQRTREDGSVARPQSPHPWPARVSVTRASANGARWEHRLDAGTVGGFGQLPLRRRVMMPDGEWEVMPMVTPMPEEENLREREEEKMRSLQEMGTKIQMTPEEQRRNEEDIERLEKQTARLSEDVEIDDEEKVRRRNFAIRREEYKYNTSGDDREDIFNYDRRPIERLEDRFGRIPAPIGLQQAAACAARTRGTGREFGNDVEATSRIEPLKIVKGNKPLPRNLKEGGIDPEIAKKVQGFMEDLKNKMIPLEPPKVPPPRARNSGDLQVYPQYLIAHSDVPGVYGRIGRTNAAVEKAREAGNAKEEAEKEKREKKEEIQDAHVESSDSENEIYKRAIWLGW